MKQTDVTDSDLWVDRYGDLLFRVALFRVNDREAAEDLVQETFIAAIKSATGFAAQSSEQTWLLGILKHKILDYYRHKYGKQNSSIDTTDDVDAAFTAKGEWRRQLEPWSELPDSELSRKEFAATLKDCLAGLPQIQRQVFLLREVDGYATEEICKDGGITSTNLWVLLHRARKKLRDCLDVNWFREGPSC